MNPFGPDCFKSLSDALLRQMETRFIEELKAIGRITYESGKLSGESMIDLMTLQTWRTSELKAVRAELAIRTAMMPTPATTDIDVFTLSEVA